MFNLSRRAFLIALLLTANFAVSPSIAKDGESGNSGTGNSGSGNSNDDEDNDDDDDDDESGGSEIANPRDHERALRAVQRGKAVSLSRLKDFLNENYPGKILAVSLRRKSGKYFYRVRILSPKNRITSVLLNAQTLQPGLL